MWAGLWCIVNCFSWFVVNQLGMITDVFFFFFSPLRKSLKEISQVLLEAGACPTCLQNLTGIEMHTLLFASLPPCFYNEFHSLCSVFTFHVCLIFHFQRISSQLAQEIRISTVLFLFFKCGSFYLYIYI